MVELYWVPRDRFTTEREDATVDEADVTETGGKEADKGVTVDKDVEAVLA